LSGSLFSLFWRFFALKIVKYASILLFLKQKIAENISKNQAKLVFRDALL